MKYTLKKAFEKILLYCRNNIVTNINDEFTKFTGFTKEEIIGRSLTEVSCMLKIDSQVSLLDIDSEYNCYMFTKEYEPRDVTIVCKINQSKNEKIYYINEKFNSRFEDKVMYFDQLCNDNQVGAAVYSSPDLILLKFNQKHLDFFDYPYNIKENIIGKSLKETITGYVNSNAEKSFINIIETGSSYYAKEVKSDRLKRGVTYWDISLVPIYIKGEIKYLVQTLTDVTEKVVNRMLVEEKTKQLEAVLQNISDGAFICDKEGKSIIANNVVIQGYPNDSLKELQDVSIFHKYYDMDGNEISYNKLPISRALRGEKVKNKRIISNSKGVIKIIQCNATPIYDSKGSISGGAVLYSNVTELYNQEKIIKDQKEELESIIESMYDGVYVVDKGLNITASNLRLRELVYDYNNFKKVGDALNTIKLYDFDGNLITFDDMPVRRVFRGERIEDLRLTAHRPDGIFHFSYNGSPIYDKHGNVEKAVISVRDITEQVKKDELFKKQNAMLNAIIENISDELVIMDKSGQYIMTNKAFRNRLSISPSDPITKDIIMKNAQRYDIDGNLIAFENLPTQRLARGEKFSQYRIDDRYENGYIVHGEVSGTPIYDSEGNFVAGVMLGRDIGDRLKNEENKLMKAQYEILSRTIDNLQLNYAIISYPDTKIKYINRNAFNYLRKINPRIKSIDSCIGKSSEEIFKLTMKEKAEIAIKLKELIANKESHFILTRKTFIKGKESFEKAICQPLYNLNNEITELVTIQIDITEEIEAKNKIEEALKLQDELFTNVAHELKTPLNVIFSTIQLMEMYFKNGSLEANREKTPFIINVIKQNCYRFMRLINNIVDISKVESGFLKLSLSNQNIVQVVENIVQSVSEHIKGKGINIIFDTDTEEKIIACDTFKIERIMLNLISNSVKFSNSDNNIYIYISDKNDTVEISIRDNGIGIEKKYLNRIFDRFYQVDKSLSRNAEGYGIGLSLVKSFVEMHGGKISADSEVGKGSIFKIELPSRTIEDDEIAIDKINPISNKIEMINIEFSDIYSI